MRCDDKKKYFNASVCLYIEIKPNMKQRQNKV